MKKYIPIISLLLSFLSSDIIAQKIQLTRSFDKKMEQMNLVYHFIDQSYLHVSYPDRDAFRKYDLVLEDDQSNIEIKVIIIQNPKLMFPNVKAASTISTMASNQDERDEITVQVLAQEESFNRYGADFVSIADYLPKRGITGKEYGRSISIYKEGLGMVITNIFYNQLENLESYNKIISFQSSKIKE